MLEAVWGRRIVFRSTLTSHINAARNAIGDTGDLQRLIRTVQRKGFRFIGEVDEGAATTGGATIAPSAPPIEVINGFSLPIDHRLPFCPSNMSDDPAREYFADGMTEDIITELARLRWLFVISRNSTFIYKGQPWI